MIISGGMEMKNNSFTEGAILPKLLKFMLPVLFAMFLQAMYGAVDLLVVGQFGTDADVSAVCGTLDGIDSQAVGYLEATTQILT